MRMFKGPIEPPNKVQTYIITHGTHDQVEEIIKMILTENPWAKSSLQDSTPNKVWLMISSNPNGCGTFFSRNEVETRAYYAQGYTALLDLSKISQHQLQ